MNTVDTELTITDHFEFSDTESHIDFTDTHVIILKFGRATLSLEENTAEARWVKASYDALYEKYGELASRILVDNSTIGDGEFNSDESNTIYKALIKNPAIKKIAVYGLSTGWYLFMEMFKFFAKGKLEIFNTREEALEWLQK